ncbi:hypothetical protein MOBT1_003332 [Malassezia obtusa]|uniref:Protection of telomeres protein 1 n=1 Tax=Malassezia obtusa TaxID=76774 RepID=A0AAF0E7W2_9BASI|nr:hypothetical protein MOBT1_003332 [Malassezia obtusa]
MGRPRRRTRRAPDGDVPREASSYAYPIPRTPLRFSAHTSGCVHPDTALLACDESERPMLGHCVAVDAWMEAVAQGRGATVCVAGHLVRLSELTGVPASFGVRPQLTQCVLEAPRTDDLAHVPLVFAGRNVGALHALLLRHRDEEVPVFLSGFGAETQRFGTSEAPRARVVYAQSRVALKACITSDTDGETTYTVWFECNKDAPVTQVMLPRTTPDIASPGSDAWLRTPDVRPTTPASAPTLAFTPQPSARPSPIPPAPPSLPPPSPAALRTLNGHVYTPIAALRKDTVANVMGVAVCDASVRLPMQRGRDVMVKLALADGSGANDAASTLSSNLFAQDEQALPGAVSEKDAVLLRGVQIGLFNGRTQGVGSRKVAFQWAAWNAATQTWRYAASARASDFSDAERTALLQLVAHLGNGSTPRPSVRALQTLDTLQPHTFVDTVAEVVKVFAQSTPPDLYITDFTTHKHIYDGNNKHLPVQPPDGGGGCVLQVGLWGPHAPLAVQLRAGQLVRLDNVRIRENPRTGLLTGALGSDKRLQIAPVDDDHAAVRALRARKAAWETAQAQKKRPAPPTTPTPVRRRPAPEPVYAPRFEMEDEFPTLNSLWSPE